MKRISIWIAATLVVLSAAVAVLTWIPLRRARDDWRRARVGDAIATAQSWSRFHVWPNQYRQLLAASFLSVGNRAAAQGPLDGLRGKRLLLSIVPKAAVANRLFARGTYADFLLYDAAVHSWFEPEDEVLYRAASLVATNRLGEAENAIRSADRGDLDARKLASIEAAIAQRRQGVYPYVVDAQGMTIAAYSVANHDVVAVNTDFMPLVDESAGHLTFESASRYLGTADTVETTLDSAMQKAALQALGGFRGSIVVIDPRTNELLAIATNLAGGPPANLALEQQYEPGSIVKVLTALDAISAGAEVKMLFPYNCTGDLLIDGRHFGDWLPGGHGMLPDIDEALARSCNIVFGDLGLRAGAPRLQQLMKSAGFDGQTDLGMFIAPLGRMIGPISSRYDTANFAIGLEHETTTSLHVAMLASMMANRGVLTSPRILRARRSILGEPVRAVPPQGSARIASAEAAGRVVQMMVAAATRPDATGRRAVVDGIPLALKTGTAGKRENGYNALIMAFAPVDHPKVAFGIIAESAGPAEIAGAKIAHDFLASIAPRLR